MSNLKAPFRHDFVGSFLRPQSVKQAHIDFEAGKISAEELKAIEDGAILDLVAKQKAAGYNVITDGEFRRATWHLDFMWGFEGVGHSPTETGLPFHGEAAMVDDTYLTGKVSYKGGHPFVEHFKFVKALEDDTCVAKQTIPAPAQFLEQMVLPFAADNTAKYYDNNEDLLQDVCKAYQDFIKDIYAAGCRFLQLDDCSWGMLVDPMAPIFFNTDEDGLQEVRDFFLRANNLALEGKPDDLVVATHVCRGNFHSTYASSGAYDSVASTLLAKEDVDAFYLEFDDERSGGFEPLAQVPADKKVVIGVITSKSPVLEDKEAVKARIQEATKYISLDQLCLSPQCGFASCEIGNKLTEAEQWAKLALVKEIAEEVWG